MLKGLIGRKIGMTQIFDEAGVALPVTLIEAGPCFVTQVRGQRRKVLRGPAWFLNHPCGRRARAPEGQQLPRCGFCANFAPSPRLKVGDKVTVGVLPWGTRGRIGVSKGKGFAGAVKRHHFHGMDAATALRSESALDQLGHSGPRSIGIRRPGHMGTDRVTAQNLKVVLVDAERNLIGLNGSVPGGKGSLVILKETRKQ
jgi:large subunit ribosomal protein L3